MNFALINFERGIFQLFAGGYKVLHGTVSELCNLIRMPLHYKSLELVGKILEEPITHIFTVKSYTYSVVSLCEDRQYEVRSKNEEIWGCKTYIGQQGAMYCSIRFTMPNIRLTTKIQTYTCNFFRNFEPSPSTCDRPSESIPFA